MNMILKLGVSALTVGMAITSAGCAKSGASTPTAGATAAQSAAAVTSPPQNAEEKIPRVRVDEAKKMIEEGKAVIIDVRLGDAYKTSHIKGALEFPLNKLESGDFKDLPKDKLIIAYCG
jgi:3-mercaptopyruvate sulfurtransferase SseA